MTRGPVARLCGYLVTNILISIPLFAQLDTGRITVAVRDATGSAVPGATVALRDQRSGTAVRTATTNELGSYTFPLIPSGNYSVRVERQGFKAYERPGVYLQVNDEITVPVVLEVGQLTEQVTVTDMAPLVESTSGVIRETVDRVRVSELPLNGRNVLQLQNIIPGAVSAGSLDQSASTPGYSINGGISSSNAYSLDGGEYQDSYFNAPLPFPNPDAIQEFTIQTNSYGAEFGRNRGASINAVTKSGTNELHGGAFEFVRNDVFDARPFFATSAPPFKRNQFGAQAGGPIRKNKTFFFGAWQGTHERGTPTTSTATMLTPKMRTGDFSELPRQITDPLSNSPFPGNVIPASRLSAPALNFLKYVPLPNQGQYFVTPLNSPKDANQYLIRIDQELGSNDSLYGRYVYNDDYIFGTGGNLPNWGIDQTFHRQGVVVGETHLFSPSLVNSFSYAFNRAYSYIVQTPDVLWSDLGANIPPASPVTHSWQNLSINGYFTASTGTFWDLGRNTHTVNDSLSWNRGRHSVKFGTQITHYRVNQINEYYSRFGGSFNGFVTGNSAADYMLGRMYSFHECSVLGNDLGQTLWHFFASDDIKVTRRLNISIGVRWEPDFHFTEESGKESSFRPGEQSSVYAKAPQGLLFKGDPQLPSNVINPNLRNFAPRFSFAYDVLGNGKLALRGGYGIFFDVIRSINLNRFPLIQPFVLDITVNDVNLADPFNGKSPYPFVPPATPEEKKAFQFITPAATTSFNSDFRTPYSQQWNFNIQRQLPFEIVVTAAYVGSKNARLFGSHNINPAVYGPGATVANTDSRRLFKDFLRVEEESTVGYSQYHSFQLTVNKRYSRGLTVLAAYTVSKNTGLTSGQSEGGVGTRDPWNWNLDKGILGDDRPQILSVSYIWDVPSIFKQGVGKAVLGGWEFTGILSAVSGSPLAIRAGTDRSLNGQGLDTADIVGDWRISGQRSRQDQMNAWFDKTAFAMPALGTVGNSGVSLLRGPGSYNLDFGLFRNFRVTERFKLQFRAEFFNALNHTKLNNPNVTLNNVNFGKILGTGTPRVSELGLKMTF